MKFLCFTIFLFCVQVALAQNQQTNNISGVVIDTEDSSPVQFAYLYLKNYPDFSALADEQGEFKFFFPSQFWDEIVVISSIGYQKLELPVSSLSKTGNIIRLQRQLLSLNEVTVMPEDHSMEEMISNAIDNIPKNYPDKRHQLRGFYRKISTNYEEFTKLVEAAVVVEDVSYLKDGSALRVKLESLRQSDELGEVDSTMTILKQRIREQIKASGSTIGPLNEIIETYHHNNGFRGNAYHSKSWFGKDGDRFMGIPELPTYRRFMGEEIVGNDTIYQIAFSTKDPPNGSSYLKINARNHAIVEYQITFQTGEYQTFAKFREVDGFYYPEMIRNRELRLINRDVGIHQMDISTFWFDMPATEDLKKIRAKDALDRDEEVENNEYELDSSFWKTYDIIKKHPLDSAIIRSLEKNKSLEQQFKSNAKD
ncbi:carboxypeptidase-like regulatory domain-containing protein [Algoriphagus aquimarinus]|uniref:Carboxypeptidase-like regulatory domain-containing protein n=1 Tax=Algoriphagus aquimarinus TaxID=237018 RepID=A0A5C7AFJ0_9BACT|nr:carboxypeptidase-like regulatory domain-containing protein [Algoriphagus aquimarinus]TXE07546.1 carboxypeptidase-like regulatory domain-containing protein [Algoriphagus aquimarinus]